MVIALSPALIMALVGSLCFFLIEVFYRGLMAGTVRWVMFWFVVAIVLVARIAIEKSSENAAVYGLGLAAAVWLYLLRTQRAYLLGIPLLALVWYCAHKLVWDCTLIHEDEDSSGHGLLQTAPPAKAEPKGQAKISTKAKTKPKRKAPSSPGLWVVYFSLAALPLFGIGQALLPATASGSRRMGLILVVVYMGAALGLLVTTSFLGLRRYLRQRYLRMPAAVALAWLKLGGGVAFVVLVAALLLPRPGANQVWTTLGYQIDYQLRQASRYASKSNPHGEGEGRAGNDTGGKQGESKTSSQQEQSHQKAPDQTGASTTPPAQPPQASVSAPQADSMYRFLRTALLVVAALVAGWWLIRCRDLLLEIARSVANFFRKLFDFMPARRPAKPNQPEGPIRRPPRPLAEYKNPFYAGQDYSQSASEIIIYTYDFVQAWAREQGIELHPEQTAREFCREMAERSPELSASYRQLSFLYAHAAYGLGLPAHYDMEPLKELWRQLTWNISAPA